MLEIFESPAKGKETGNDGTELLLPSATVVDGWNCCCCSSSVIMGLLKGFLLCTKRPSIVRKEFGEMCGEANMVWSDGQPLLPPLGVRGGRSKSPRCSEEGRFRPP